MKVCWFEYDLSSADGGADAFVREVNALLRRSAPNIESDVVQFDRVERLADGVKHVSEVDMESYDIVLHGMCGAVNREKDEILETMARLKHPRTVYVDHDRYPVYRAFWHQKKKARSVHACDHTITCHPWMYESVGFPSERVHELELFLTPRSVENTVMPIRPMSERDIHLMFLARISPKKGSEDFLEFATRANAEGIIGGATMYGFSGAPAELGAKGHPSVITNIHKDESKLIRNSDDAFILLKPFVKGIQNVYDKFARARITWTSYRISSQNRDVNVRMHRAYEGVQLECILNGSIMICNEIQRELEIFGKRWEDYKCSFFFDGDMDKLLSDVRNADLEKMQKILLLFRKAFFQDMNFVDAYERVFKRIIDGGKHPTSVIEESKFADLKRNGKLKEGR